MANERKKEILQSVLNDDFSSWSSVEIEAARSLLKEDWDFSGYPAPASLEDYLKEFPHIQTVRRRKSVIQDYLRVNGRLRIVGFRALDNRNRYIYSCECECGESACFAGSMPISCGCLTRAINNLSARYRSVVKLEKSIGEKHNRLEIVGVSSERVAGKGMVLVKCDCGQSEEFSVVYQSLIPRGKDDRVNTKSCGCLERELALERKKEEASKYIGKVKGMLRISSLAGYHSLSRKQLVNVDCLACGGDDVIRLNDWLTGRQKTCGCRMGVRERKSYVGTKYLYLEVIDDAKDRVLEGGRAVRFVRCKCHACGRNDYEVRLDNIINKQQVSCGCIRTSGKDNLVDFLMDKDYACRESSFYLVDVLYRDKNYLKIGIAFNFANRKSVAKRSGAPYVKVHMIRFLERQKAWLLEQLLLQKFRDFRLFESSGIVVGGTEMFKETLPFDLLSRELERQYEAIHSTSFYEYIAQMGCTVPRSWIAGHYSAG